MWNIFRSIGVIDKLKQKGSLKYYEEKLHEYKENEADVLIDIALLYYDEEKYDESLYNLKKAEQIYKSLNEKESEAFVKDLTGDVYLSMREVNRALEKYEGAYVLYSSVKSKMKEDLFEKINEVKDIKEAIELAKLDNMEEEYLETPSENVNPDLNQNNKNELDLEKKSIECHISYEKIALNMEKIMKIIRKKYNIKGPTKAEYETGYFQKCIFDEHKNENDEREVGMLQILADFLMRENKPFSALQNLKTAFQISHENENKKGEAFSLLLLGVVYYLLGKENKIYDIFKKSLTLFKELNYKEGEEIAFNIINTLYNEDECSYVVDTA